MLGIQPGPEVIKHFSCSTQLSLKLKLLINVKIDRINGFASLIHQSQSFILLINAEMPTVVGILAFMRMINFMLS